MHAIGVVAVADVTFANFFLFMMSVSFIAFRLHFRHIATTFANHTSIWQNCESIFSVNFLLWKFELGLILRSKVPYDSLLKLNFSSENVTLECSNRGFDITFIECHRNGLRHLTTIFKLPSGIHFVTIANKFRWRIGQCASNVRIAIANETLYCWSCK